MDGGMVTCGGVPSIFTVVVAVVAFWQASTAVTVTVTTPHVPRRTGCCTVTTWQSSTAMVASATAARASAADRYQGTDTAGAM